MALWYCSWPYLICMIIWLVLLGGSLFLGLRRRQHIRALGLRSRWIDFALIGWVFVATLTLLELAFAVAYDTTDSYSMTNVSQRWFRRHVQLNPQGFRDRMPLTRKPPAGRERILFLGDSFTFGHGIRRTQDRFSDLVGSYLEESHPGRYVTANLGQPGFNIDDINRVAEQNILAPGLDAEFAIYTICLNDIEKLAPRKAQPAFKGWGLSNWFIFRDTYFFNLLKHRAQQLLLPQMRNYYDDLRGHYTGPSFDHFCHELDRLQSTLKKSRTKLLLVVFPFLHNLGPDYPFREAHRRIVTAAKQRDIRICDLEPELASHVQEGLVVNPFDAHPNERAHALAARIIIQQLLQDLK